MLKKIRGMIPYLLPVLLLTAAVAILDGYVTKKMVGILDLALSGQRALIGRLAPGLLFTAALLVPLGVLEAVANNQFKKKTNITLKGHYLERVFNKNLSEFQKENNAIYLSAMTNDFNTLEVDLITGIYAVVQSLSYLLVGVWLLSSVDFRMFFLALGMIGMNFFVSFATKKPAKKAYRERSLLFDDYTSYIKEVLSAFHIVKNYNLYEKVKSDYDKKSEAIQQKGYLIERLMSFIFATEHLFMDAAIYGIVCYMGYMVVIGKITPGGLLLVIQGVQRMTWPVFRISETLPKLFTSGDLIQKIEHTLDNQKTYQETISLQEFKDKIEFRNVSFHYEDDPRTILHNVNLEFKKNGKYLIVGPSGGGKSTLLKLFRKYFDPTEGSIYIDGHNLKEVIREDYFLQVANIEQQVFVFEDTIRNNLTLYKNYTEEEIWQAVSLAGLKEFVEGLEQGLDTMLYDNGKNISGGERSRLVIARALLSKAKILFMDEAFASLDMERAREIEKTILQLEDITVINVSHVIFKETVGEYEAMIHVKGTAS